MNASQETCQNERRDGHPNILRVGKAAWEEKKETHTKKLARVTWESTEISANISTFVALSAKFFFCVANAQ